MSEGQEVDRGHNLEEAIRNQLAAANVEPPEEGETGEEREASNREAMAEFNQGLEALSPTEPRHFLGERDSTEEPAAEVEAQQEADVEAIVLPNLDPKVPEELQEWLDTPDFDEPEDVVIETEFPEEEEEEEYEDEQVKQLRSQLAKERKRREWAEGNSLKAKREKWTEEAKKYFPLSEYALGEIQATSHRGFLREAKKAHMAVQPHVNAFIKRLAEGRKEATDAAVADAYAKAGQAWGKPTVAPGGRDETVTEAQNDKIRNAKNLEERVKARIWG